MPAAVWALGTLAAVGVTAPLYLVARPSRRATWGLAEIAGLVLFFAVTIPLAGALVVRPVDDRPPLWLIAALATVQNAGFVAAGVYIVRVKYGLPLARLGLDAGRLGRRAWQGVLAGAGSVAGNSVGQHLTVLALALVMGHRAAAELVNRVETQAPIYRLLPHLRGSVELILLGALIAIVVPVGEEVFFRGLVLGALRRMIHRHAAVALSAALFAAAHLQPVEFLPLVILGVILAYLYEATGSLVPGMIAHGLNNVVALVLFIQSSP